MTTTVWFLVIIGTGVLPMPNKDVCLKAMANMNYSMTYCFNSNSGAVYQSTAFVRKK